MSERRMPSVDKVNKLPSIKELISEEGVEAYKKQDQLNHLLSQQPPKEWIKQHPYIKKEIVNEKGMKVRVPYEYLPIDKVEYLLRRIFKSFKIEILREGQLFNAVYVTVRVHYLDVVSGDWRFHDGTGALQLQTSSGASASDFNSINNGAVTMALPHAKTLAIKDACDMFGDLFGANINRDSTQAHVMTAQETDREKLERLFVDKYKYLSTEQKRQIKDVIDTDEKTSYKKAIKVILDAQTSLQDE